MAKSAQASQWTGYAGTVTMLVLALLFPVGLMVFNPTLMFERGWEQYVGTGIYFWAVVTLCRDSGAFGGTRRRLKTRPLCSNGSTRRWHAVAARDGSQSSSAFRRRRPDPPAANPPVDEFFEGEPAARR